MCLQNNALRGKTYYDVITRKFNVEAHTFAGAYTEKLLTYFKVYIKQTEYKTNLFYKDHDYFLVYLKNLLMKVRKIKNR